MKKAKFGHKVIALVSIPMFSALVSLTYGDANNGAHQGVARPPDYVIKEFQKGSIFPKGIRWTPIDINGDGHKDWFIVEPGLCGSQGCTGMVYLNENGHYCYVGTIAEEDLGDVRRKDLKCEMSPIIFHKPN